MRSERDTVECLVIQVIGYLAVRLKTAGMCSLKDVL